MKFQGGGGGGSLSGWGGGRCVRPGGRPWLSGGPSFLMTPLLVPNQDDDEGDASEASPPNTD